MTSDESLRQLLGELAGNPPAVLGRKEAVMTRISRRTQRQAAVRGAGTLAVVLLLGLGGLTTSHAFRNAGSDGHQSLSTEPTHSPSPSPTSPSPTTSPAPSQEPTTSPAPPRTEPTASPAPTHHESPPPAPAPENTTASGPLTLTVTMDPSTAHTGTTVHARLVARDGAGALKHVHIEWGDGKVTDFSPSGDPGCRTTHLDGDFTHTYSATGTLAVHVTVTSGDACSAEESVTRESHVTITGDTASPSPSPACGNGPSTPVAGGSPASGDNASYAYVHATGSDSDGVLHRIVINWGDGSSTTVGEWSTGGSHDGTKSHHYSTAGDHTVTITVWSTDCSGGSTQEASTQVTVNQAQA